MPHLVNYCRNCGSEKTEKLFFFPHTFFWYGVNTDFFEKNIIPKYMDAVILFCNECGFMGLPVDDTLRDLLNVLYRSPDSVTGATLDKKSTYSIRLAQDFFGIFSKLLDGRMPEKILEVGCQQGYLLYELKKRGARRVVGVEPGSITPWVDDNGETLDVRHGFLSREIVRENDFDFVYSLNVLEHVEQPKEFLHIIYDSMKEGGMLLLAVPNELFSLQECNLGMFMFQHLNYFIPESLKAMLRECGFTIKKVISARKEPIYILAEKTQTKDININFGHEKDKIRKLLVKYQEKLNDKLNIIHRALKKSKSKPLGFYGVAGCINIFSWLPVLFERPCAVFDSDSLTWGKSYGGIPCPVMSPQRLNEVTDVISVPFRLQEEIVSIIAEKEPSVNIHRLY